MEQHVMSEHAGSLGEGTKDCLQVFPSFSPGAWYLSSFLPTMPGQEPGPQLTILFVFLLSGNPSKFLSVTSAQHGQLSPGLFGTAGTVSE